MAETRGADPRNIFSVFLGLILLVVALFVITLGAVAVGDNPPGLAWGTAIFFALIAVFLLTAPYRRRQREADTEPAKPRSP